MSENIRGVGFRKLVKKNAKNRFFNSNFWMVFKNIVKNYKKTIVLVKLVQCRRFYIVLQIHGKFYILIEEIRIRMEEFRSAEDFRSS